MVNRAYECFVADRRANHRNPKGFLIVLLFRVAHGARGSRLRPRPISLPIGILYRVTVEWMLGVELPWKTRVGKGLRIDHGVGLVVNDNAVIGDWVTLRQATTIGSRYPGGGAPRIDDHVDIGANAVVIGDISVGFDSRVAAGAVVIENVPSQSTVVGNPGRIVGAARGGSGA